MGANASQPRLKLSAWNNQDSDNLAMLKTHAYQAQSDGQVGATVDSQSGGIWVRGYVGLTNDPAGAGDRIGANFTGSASSAADVSFDVAKGEYFEITTNSNQAVAIFWKSWGPLQKPVDFN